MKLSVLQEHLARGLGIVGRAVNTRSTLPVLGNVLLATDRGRLKLSATNLEIVITCWVDAKIEEEGATTIPARTLSDLVNALPRERVELELSDESQMLHIAAGRTEANVHGIQAKEFPLVPEPDLTQSIRLDAGEFQRMINRVEFAAASEDTRPTLTGVSLRIDGNQLKMAATDAFRLSVVEAEIPAMVDEPLDIIIPARALREVARIATAEDESIYISLPQGRNQIVFKLDSVVIVSQLIEGAFPDFTQIIPSSSKTVAVMSTASFLKACKTADIFARESSHTARVSVNPGNELVKGSTTIMAVSAETGDNVAQVDAEVDGDDIEIAFNVRYLTDVLGVIDTPQVALKTSSALEPGVVTPIGEDAGGFFHVIMPMHFGR